MKNLIVPYLLPSLSSSTESHFGLVQRWMKQSLKILFRHIFVQIAFVLLQGKDCKSLFLKLYSVILLNNTYCKDPIILLSKGILLVRHGLWKERNGLRIVPFSKVPMWNSGLISAELTITFCCCRRRQMYLTKSLVKIKFVGLDSWEIWKKHLEFSLLPRKLKWVPRLQQQKIVSLLLICLCEVNWWSQ